MLVLPAVLSGFDAGNSESYKTFRMAMGDRLLPHYEPDGSVFVYKLPGATVIAACGSGFSCARNARSGRICAALTQQVH